MRTVAQVRRKADSLKKKLEPKPIVENFGDKEIRELENFIGNSYNYSYLDRLAIDRIQKEFYSWCCNFCCMY